MYACTHHKRMKRVCAFCVVAVCLLIEAVFEEGKCTHGNLLVHSITPFIGLDMVAYEAMTPKKSGGFLPVHNKLCAHPRSLLQFCTERKVVAGTTPVWAVHTCTMLACVHHMRATSAPHMHHACTTPPPCLHNASFVVVLQADCVS